MEEAVRMKLLRFNGAVERDPTIDAWMKEHAVHADEVIDMAAQAFADIIREGPRKKTL